MTPKCVEPKCRVFIPLEIVRKVMSPTWFQSLYNPYRQDILFQAEKTQLADTSSATKAYLSALSLKAIIKVSDSNAALMNNVAACIENWGQGWENYDFMGNGPKTLAGNAFTGYMTACPTPTCRGFVTELDWMCNLCSAVMCEHCHELKRTVIHCCDPNTVATVKAIASEAKPCPKCMIPISKVDGCDQMFCTQCHVTYSWKTGQIIKGQIHNPHFFEWLHRQEQRPVTLRNITTCEDYIDYHRLMACFGPAEVKAAQTLRGRLPAIHDILQPFPSADYYVVALVRLHQVILHVRSTSGNHANVQPVNNHDLRVRLQLDEISEPEVKTELLRRYDEHYRCMSYCHIYMHVYNTAIILFDNLYVLTCKRGHISDASLRKKSRPSIYHDTYLSLQRLLSAANESLDFNNQVFGSDVRFVKFATHPFGATLSSCN